MIGLMWRLFVILLITGCFFVLFAHLLCLLDPTFSLSRASNANTADQRQGVAKSGGCRKTLKLFSLLDVWSNFSGYILLVDCDTIYTKVRERREVTTSFYCVMIISMCLTEQIVISELLLLRQVFFCLVPQLTFMLLEPRIKAMWP